MSFSTAFIMPLLLAATSQAPAPAAPPPKANAAQNAAFEAVLARHIAAIQQRNMAEMEATITAGPDLDLIFPNGKHSGTRDAFLAFHRTWFADKNWSMTFERVRITVGKDMAVALYRAGYTDTNDGKSETRYNWLNLTFRKENGRWVLIHDQNTKIV